MRPSSVTTPGGAGVSPWLVVDAYSSGDQLGLFCVLNGVATYSVEMTADDVFDPTVVPTAFPCGIAALTAVSANAAASLAVPCKAVRVNQSAGAGTVKMTAIQSAMTT